MPTLKMEYYHGILLAIIGISMCACLTFADDNEYRLIHDLLRNYDKRIRPSRNATEPMNVTFGLALSQIIDVDEKNQIITTNCWLNQNWQDVKLKWNSTDYNGIKEIVLPYDVAWKPDTILYNNADSASHWSSMSTNIMVTSDGNVTWLSMVIFKSSCSVDVKYFPFDEQNCSMWFGSWSYDSKYILLKTTSDEGDKTNYIPNTEWQLVELHVEEKNITFSCCITPWPMVVYTVQMRRKPLFYIFNMVLPCNLITLVALLGFYVPSDSGEKITMGITTLLSMTVFLMIVADSMPATSDVLPLIGLYYGITIAIVSFATAMTVFTLNIHHKGFRGKEVPDYIKKICFGFLAKILCLRLDLPETAPGDMQGGTTNDQTTSTSPTTVSYIPTPMDNPLINSPDSGVIDLHEFRNNRYQQDMNFRETEPLYNTFTSGEGGETGNSSYMRLRQANKWLRPETGKTHMTQLDFVPQGEFKRRYDSEPGTIPENGGLSPRMTSRLRNPGTGGTSRSTSNTNSTNTDDFERQFLRVLQKVYQTIEKNEMRLADQDRRDAIKLEWQQVALVVDRLLLTLFVGATLGVTLAILFQAPYSTSSLFGSQQEERGGFFVQ
ncbi:neuronal acetylcholine receptor subunit alpha-10-like isoform X2 [Lineus longissimus]|uniref:neuronal acetylcholine receptor subunit alpha-10-like isoform X2 n=1 Tax=Lineus longissimus TaxID=88925 RepID=UPI00315C7C28